MDDHEIVQRIETLVDEEHQLRADGLQEGEDDRLRELEVALDRCWDLLRRRRAARSAGTDPDEVQAPSESTVEGYIQ